MSKYNMSELAIDNDFSSESYDPDVDGIYTVVEYRRKDGTLYMRSTLHNRKDKGIYELCKLSYFDQTGKIKLHEMNWRLGYDINRKIVSKGVSD